MLAITIRLVDGKWIETTAVILRTPPSALARWMTAERTIHSRPLDQHEDERCGQADAMTIFYSRRASERMRFHPRSTSERMSWLLFFVMGGLGLFSFLLSTILLFIPE